MAAGDRAMSHQGAREKLAKAAQLSAQAAKLFSEAAEELAQPEEDDRPTVRRLDDAQVAASLRRAGVRV
jgi:hypothetical protein